MFRYTRTKMCGALAFEHVVHLHVYINTLAFCLSSSKNSKQNLSISLEETCVKRCPFVQMSFFFINLWDLNRTDKGLIHDSLPMQYSKVNALS